MDKKKIVALALGLIIIAGIGIGIYSRTRRASDVSSSTKNESIQNTQTASSGKNSVSDDPCTEFTKEFVASAIGKPVVKTVKYDYSENHACQYFVNDNQMVQIDIEHGNVDDQKTANEYLGWKVQKDDRIPMDNFLVWQETNILNKLYLIIDSNTSVMITRTAADVLDNDTMIAFAAVVAGKIGKGNTGFSPTPTDKPKQNSTVPLPQETDIIRSFFTIIGEHRPSDAVSMLAPDQVNDESEKQAWAVQFNAFSSLTVTSVEPDMQEDWTDSRHEYKVVLTAAMKPESASAPIPYYGWDNGTNTRWVTIVKSGTLWKIAGIGTGP